jgi:hypothetical protein
MYKENERKNGEKGKRQRETERERERERERESGEKGCKGLKKGKRKTEKIQR